MIICDLLTSILVPVWLCINIFWKSFRAHFLRFFKKTVTYDVINLKAKSHLKY